MIDKEALSYIRSIDARTASYSTDEQAEFASDFTKPMISFSNPGTGKTHSIVKGLIMAQTLRGVSGRKINAMSYTTASTAELSRRYELACKKNDMTPTVKFNTCHSIFRAIILDAYPDMKINSGAITDEDLMDLRNSMRSLEIDTSDMFYVKETLQTINALNHALIYDPENVKQSYKFQKLGMDLDDFQALRKTVFRNKLMSRNIGRGDLPLFALYTLCKRPETLKKFRAMYDIMVVDEFQDMTKMFIIILSMISSNVIAIGDMKQQIYGYNGASPFIADLYLNLFPDAKVVNLTQSFRCKNEIADFASGIIKPNNRPESFKGTEDGAIVEIKPAAELDLQKAVAEVAEDRRIAHETGVMKETMFLVRNNYSIIPVVEELFKQGVPFRVKDFKKVMDLPVFKELCWYANIAREPSKFEHFKYVPFIFPQFKKYRSEYWNNPVYKEAEIRYNQTGLMTSIYELSTAWDSTSQNILYALRKVEMAMDNGRMCATIFNMLMPLYEQYVIEGKWWRLDKTLEYYMDLIKSIVNNKTYEQMFSEECAKEVATQNAIKLNKGVKCYTIHSAKGLEADTVYILDADDGVMPNTKELDRMIKKGCHFEAAKVLREERNLLYVGITRAKSRVVITYNGDLTPLISSIERHKYSYLDDIYENSRLEFDDLEYFKITANIKEDLSSDGIKSVKEPVSNDLDSLEGI